MIIGISQKLGLKIQIILQVILSKTDFWVGPINKWRTTLNSLGIKDLLNAENKRTDLE